ncbi:MAG TPA: prepilin peptidase [Candidatus Paceibacterota bacterium]
MFYIILFGLGAVIGSFLNVVILRLGTGRSISRGQSICFNCGHTLSPFELIPIVSFVLQRGRCLNCRVRISAQYPSIELLSAVGFVLLAHQTKNILLLVIVLIIYSLSLAIVAYDIKHKIIPDRLVYPLIGFAFVWFLINSGYSNGWIEILAGPLAASFFALLWLLSGGRWMGFGDAKLAFAIGLFLGARGVLEAVILAFWIGAIVGIVLLLVRHHSITMKSEIPFAPFLAGAMFLEYLIPSYLHII